MYEFNRPQLSRWITQIDFEATADGLLSRAEEGWTEEQEGRQSEPIVFPLFPHKKNIFLSFRDFTELVDCCFEAHRKGTSVSLVIMDHEVDPLHMDKLKDVVKRTLPYPPHEILSLDDIPEVGRRLARLYLSSQKKIAVHERIGLLTSLVCKSLNTQSVYLTGSAHSSRFTEHLKPLMPLPHIQYNAEAYTHPFTRECVAKPSDPLWFLAFTSGTAHTAQPVPSEIDETKDVFKDMWDSLMARGLARPGVFQRPQARKTIGIEWHENRAITSSEVITLAPAVISPSRATVLLTKSYAAFFGMQPSSVIMSIDDSLGEFGNEPQLPSEAKELYRDLGRKFGFDLSFSSDDDDGFNGRRAWWAGKLTGEDIWSTIPKGVQNRSRGRLLGADVARLVSAAAQMNVASNKIISLAASDIPVMRVVQKYYSPIGYLISRGFEGVAGNIHNAAEIDEFVEPKRTKILTAARGKFWVSPQSFMRDPALRP